MLETKSEHNFFLYESQWEPTNPVTDILQNFVMEFSFLGGLSL